MYTIYTKQWCTWCEKAKKLLTRSGYSYTEIELNDETKAQLLERAPGAKSVPQIFLGDTYIGGYTDLEASLT